MYIVSLKQRLRCRHMPWRKPTAQQECLPRRRGHRSVVILSSAGRSPPVAPASAHAPRLPRREARPAPAPSRVALPFPPLALLNGPVVRVHHGAPAVGEEPSVDLPVVNPLPAVRVYMLHLDGVHEGFPVLGLRWRSGGVLELVYTSGLGLRLLDPFRRGREVIALECEGAHRERAVGRAVKR